MGEELHRGWLGAMCCGGLLHFISSSPPYHIRERERQGGAGSGGGLQVWRRACEGDGVLFTVLAIHNKKQMVYWASLLACFARL